MGRMTIQKFGNSRQCANEIFGELRIGNLSNDNEQCHFVMYDRLQLIRRIANPLVVGNRYPAAAATVFEPLFIGAIRRKQIVMALDFQPRRDQRLRKLLAEVSIGKEDPL